MHEDRGDDTDHLQPLLRANSDDEIRLVLDGPGKRKHLEEKLLRKLDIRMSILVLIYILNYIDRNNAAAARLRGFQSDLNLSDSQFATVLSILYIGYFLMQVPSNIYLNHAGKPSIYLPFCMIVWGGISICTGFTTTYFGVLCTRFFLGFVEAAFYPGALFLISRWYKRSELSQRLALLTCGSLLSNAFGALIASGILNIMDNVLGYTAWRWLFFVEGSVTVVVAICAIYILPDFPETSTGWLTPAEKALAIQRMVEDSNEHPTGDVSAKQDVFRGLNLAFRDGKVWALTFGMTSLVVSLSFHVYFPTITATLGFSPTITLLLCAPPWGFATVVSMLVSRHSDRQGERCKHIVVPLCIGILGFTISMFTMNIVWRYMSLFLMAQSYAGFICLLAWTSTSISQPASKRAAALALINSVSQAGNILGSFVWPTAWGPSYNASYAICIFSTSVTILFCFWFQRHLSGLNARADKREGEMGVLGGSYRYML